MMIMILLLVVACCAARAMGGVAGDMAGGGGMGGAGAHYAGRAGLGQHMGASSALLGGFDPSQPVYVTVVEPGFKQQLWKTFRFALFVFLVISGLSAVFDDRGISSKLMMSTNLHMAESSDKRFADVMGVRPG